MSWLESLRSDSVGGSGAIEDFSGMSSEATAMYSDVWDGEEEELIEHGSPRRRVKEDLSEFTKALSSKFWGVASFLASSPSSQTPSSPSPPTIYNSAESSPPLRRQQQESTISGESDLVVSNESSRTAGIRSDFAEIGGTLKTGIARLSNNVAINGISKIASAILPLREEEEEKDEEIEREEYEDEHVSDVIGVTDEVLAFARNIACHPETWLDFPLLSDDEDFDDFDMSVTQQDHALVIESLAPRLAALRIELCPTHMSIGYFWKIYFALLHPRLNKHDADLLSTPQIVETRAMLQHGLQNHAKQESKDFWRHPSFKDADDALTSPEQFSTPRMPISPTKPWLLSSRRMTSSSINDFETENHSIITSEAEFVDKFVVNEESYLQTTKVKEMALHNLDEEEDDDDEWPEDETQDAVLIYNEEDISFSDLENDDFSSFSKTSKSAVLKTG